MSENTQKDTEQTVKEEKKVNTRKEKKEKTRIAELEKTISELEEKVAKDKDDYIRLMAEFDNYRRRTAQEKLEIVSMASTETIKGFY